MNAKRGLSYEPYVAKQEKVTVSAIRIRFIQEGARLGKRKMDNLIVILPLWQHVIRLYAYKKQTLYPPFFLRLYPDRVVNG